MSSFLSSRILAQLQIQKFFGMEIWAFFSKFQITSFGLPRYS